jgi:UDP-N-acetylglucosamine 2-epimerase (non-hydrolysing)
LPYSSIARENLLHDGLPSDRIIKTGSPQIEVLNHYNKQIEESQILDTLTLGYKEYFLVSVHREENCTPEKFKELVDMLNSLADKYHQRIIISAHPRIASRLNTFGGDFRNEIEIHKPFGFLDYNKLQCHARVVLSDSGTITEEAILAHFPALNLREAHERPEGMEQAAVIMSGFKNAVAYIPMAEKIMWVIPDDWVSLNVSQKVARIILSYVDYVNRTVWRK